MDQAKILDFKKTLTDSSNILILLPEYINSDTASAATILYHFISQTMKKNVLIASSNKMPVKFSSFLAAFGIEEKFILSEIKPLQYVINIKDTEKDLELLVNRKEDGVEIVMIPKLSDIDMSKITVKTSGTKFDLFITFNTQALEDLGTLYNKTEELFQKVNIVSILPNLKNNTEVSYTSNIISDTSSSTSSEIVYEVLNGFGASLNENEKDVLLEGITAGTDGLHKIVSPSTLDRVTKLVDKRDISNKFKDLFYSYSHEGLEIRKRIFSSLKNINNVAFSSLSIEDLNESGVKSNQLEGIDFLPFNIEDDIETYLLSYPFNNQNRILIESKDLISVYNKLKDSNIDVARTINLLCVSTSKSVEQIAELLLGQSINSSTNSETSSQNLFDNPFSESSNNESNSSKPNEVSEVNEISDTSEMKEPTISNAQAEENSSERMSNDSQQNPIQLSNDELPFHPTSVNTETTGPFNKANSK